MSEKLFLLDGMAIAYRSFYAFQKNHLRNAKGENTSALFGFVKTLFKILEKDKPDYFAVAFDLKGKTFRHKMYPQYKANRQSIPEELAMQLGKLRDVVKAFNIPILELEGFEADDLMGTFAKKAEKKNILTYLVTADKDFMQLISELIKIYKPVSFNQWQILGAEDVLKKFSVNPDLVVDVLSLIGDKSDNIPGVNGIGDKSAIPLVQQFGNIENIIANLHKIENKVIQKKIEDGKESAVFSKKLLIIDTNVPFDLEIEDLKLKEKNYEKLSEIFRELDFKEFLKNVNISKSLSKPVLQNENTKNISTEKVNYKLITTQTDLVELSKKILEYKKIVFDTETTSQNPLKSQIVGLSICLQEGEAFYVAFDFNAENTDENLFSLNEKKNKSEISIDFFKKIFQPIFEDESILKIGQNIKYDILVLSNYGIKVCGEIFDTMIAHYILNNNFSHSLDSMSMEFFNYKKISFEELFESGEKYIWEVPLEKISNYSCEDADFTMRIYNLLNSKIHKERFGNLCYEIEFPLTKVLCEMEIIGQKIDVIFLETFFNNLNSKVEDLENSIYNLIGEKFNINSPKQLSEILFNKLSLQTKQKTKTGFSTNTFVLETLVDKHPVIEKLIEHRTFSKLKSTFVDGILKSVDKNFRIHTSFHQTIAATGRLSSSNPNLQNIPIRTDIGREIRKSFITEKKWKIVSADYSQIELRIMAHNSNDEAMIEAFKNGEDIHTSTAEKLFSENFFLDSRETRRRAKEVNFGIIYGIAPYGLSQNLQIPQSEAKKIITTYFERFPKVKTFLSDTIEFARATGYVETITGRRRYIPNINSQNASLRANAERQAINSPIQGSAADMIKIAMVNLSKKFKEKNLKANLLLQIHDELVFEIFENDLNEALKLIEFEMKNALQLLVPIEITIGVGNNWFECH